MFVENIREWKTEFSGTNVFGVSLLTAVSIAHKLRHKTIIEGSPAPRHKSFIVSANHVSTHDTLKGHLWAVESGRLLRVVVKQSLIERGATESAEYLAGLGTTIEEATAEYNPLVAFCLRSMNVSGTLRHRRIDRELYRGIDVHQTHGRSTAIFFQGHRHADNTLSDLQTGAAMLAMKYPETPVHLLAFSGKPYGPDRVTGLEPTTYNRLRNQYGRELKAGEVTIIFADRIAEKLPEEPRNDWISHTRVIEAKRLKATSV